MPHKDVIATGFLRWVSKQLVGSGGMKKRQRVGLASLPWASRRFACIRVVPGIDLSGGSYDRTEPHLPRWDLVRGWAALPAADPTRSPRGRAEPAPPPIAGQRTPLPATAAPRPSMPARPTSSACDLGHVRWNTQKIRGRDREGLGSERGCCNHDAQSGGQEKCSHQTRLS